MSQQPQPEVSNEQTALNAIIELLNEGVLRPQELLVALTNASNALAVAFPDDLIRADGELHVLAMQAAASTDGSVIAATLTVVNKDRDVILALLKHIDSTVAEVPEPVDNSEKPAKPKVH